MNHQNRSVVRAAALGVAIAGTLFGAPAAHAAGPGLVHSSVHVDDEVSFAESPAENACGLDATITMHRHINASLATTQGGLDQAQLAALLFDDPDGIVRQLAMVAHGDVTITMGGHHYEGTFTQRFGGRFLPNGMYLQSGSIAAELHDEDGRLLTLHGMGNDVDDFDGSTKHAFSRGKVTGCPE